jgi:hypothetical protein
MLKMVANCVLASLKSCDIPTTVRLGFSLVAAHADRRVLARLAELAKRARRGGRVRTVSAILNILQLTSTHHFYFLVG